MTSSKVRLRTTLSVCTVRDFPVVVSYVAWKADQVLYVSCTLDIDSDNVGSCVLAVKQEQRNTVDLFEN